MQNGDLEPLDKGRQYEDAQIGEHWKKLGCQILTQELVSVED